MTKIDLFRDSPRSNRFFSQSPFFSNQLSPMGGGLFNQFESMMREFDRMMSPMRSRMSDDMMPLGCDIKETDAEYILSYDMPGMRPEDIDIEVQDNRLTISGERRMEREEGTESNRTVEQHFRNFYQSFVMPENTNSEEMEASYENGVLYLAIPKSESSEKRKINVSSESGFLNRQKVKSADEKKSKRPEAS